MCNVKGLHTCACCHKTGHVCHSKMRQCLSGQKQVSANAIWLYLQQDTLKQVQMYAMTQVRREPGVSTKSIRVLPDSEAEITAAGKETLAYLDHHPDNLLPVTCVPVCLAHLSNTATYCPMYPKNFPSIPRYPESAWDSLRPGHPIFQYLVSQDTQYYPAR